MSTRFKFKHLKAKNFLSIGEDGLSIDFDEYPLTIIIGDNGNGKTTILEALTFALFGKTYRKINKANIVNSYNGKDCLVELTIDVGNDSYRIVRGIKKDIFEVYLNGKDTPEDSYVGNEGQKRFENILGLDFNVYSRVIVLGTIGYEEFMSMSGPDRKKFVETVLGLDIISVMDKDNKGIIKNLNLKIDHLDVKLEGLGRQKIQSDESLERMKRIQESKHLERSELKEELKVLEETLINLKDNLDVIQNEHDELPIIVKPDKIPHQVLPLDEREKTKKITETIEGKRLVIDNNVKKYKDTILDHKVVVNTHKTEITKIERDIQTFELVLKRYEEGGICPTCHQDLSKHKDEVENIKDIISNKKDDMNDHLEKIFSIEINDIKKLEDLIEGTKPSYDALDEYNKKNLERLRKLDAEIDEKNKAIDLENINNEMEYRENTSDHRLLKEKLENANKDYTNACNHKESLVESIDRLKREVNDLYKYDVEQSNGLENEINELTSERDGILIDVNQHTIIGNLLKDSGIRKDIIDRYIPLFNQTVQKYLNVMGADYIFTVDANFKETIYSRGRESFRYESFSRGEQSRIDLAILFAWRDVIEAVSGQKMTSLFLDEVFDSSMDSNGVKTIKKLLTSLEGVNVFTISHRSDQVHEMFDSIIEVGKVGRFSKYNRRQISEV